MSPPSRDAVKHAASCLGSVCLEEFDDVKLGCSDRNPAASQSDGPRLFNGGKLQHVRSLWASGAHAHSGRVRASAPAQPLTSCGNGEVHESADFPSWLEK